MCELLLVMYFDFQLFWNIGLEISMANFGTHELVVKNLDI
jgi:hypothetical protein